MKVKVTKLVGSDYGNGVELNKVYDVIDYNASGDVKIDTDTKKGVCLLSWQVEEVHDEADLKAGDYVRVIGSKFRPIDSYSELGRVFQVHSVHNSAFDGSTHVRLKSGVNCDEDSLWNYAIEFLEKVSIYDAVAHIFKVDDEVVINGLANDENLVDTKGVVTALGNSIFGQLVTLKLSNGTTFTAHHSKVTHVDKLQEQNKMCRMSKDEILELIKPQTETEEEQDMKLGVGQLVRIGDITRGDHYEGIMVTEQMAKAAGKVTTIVELEPIEGSFIHSNMIIRLAGFDHLNWSERMFEVIPNEYDRDQYKEGDILECEYAMDDWFTQGNTYEVLEHHSNLGIFDNEGDFWELYEISDSSEQTFKLTPNYHDEDKYEAELSELEKRLPFKETALDMAKEKLATISREISERTHEIADIERKIADVKTKIGAKNAKGTLTVGDQISMIREYHEAAYQVIQLPDEELALLNVNSRKVLEVRPETFEDVHNYFSELYSDDEIQIVKNN